MMFNFDDERPIYLQLAEGLKDAILSGAFLEETQVPSTTEISVSYKINPATALKGINLLVEDGILYKKRGVGMFVQTGATEKILEGRQRAFFDAYIKTLVTEAQKLNISKADIIRMIEKGFEE